MNNTKLLPLDIARLYHAEFGQLMTRFYEDFAKSTLDSSTDADFLRLYNDLNAKLPTYNNALNQVKAQEESKKIALLDDARDTALQNLRNGIKPYRISDIADEANAYTALSLLLAEYKGAENDAYEGETNKLTTLCEKLETKKYSAHIDVLEISKFVTRLKDANMAFNALFSHRSYKVSQKVVYNVKALRKEIAEEYNTMAEYIAILSIVKENAYYKDVLALINNGRYYMSSVVLAKRSAKKGNKEDE